MTSTTTSNSTLPTVDSNVTPVSGNATCTTNSSGSSSFFAEIRRMSSEEDHDLREEARHQPSVFDSIAPDFYSPPAFTHHVDYHSKTQRRKLELEVLRAQQLAKPKAARLMSAAPPQDTLLDTFEERQRRWMQEDRLGRSMALETLHKFQANDKEVIYLGTPERTKTRRSDQGPITPDATASVYHSPHHLVVVVHPDDGNNVADCQPSMFRTYSYHQEGLSPSSSSSHQASPDTSQIPMSSLMKVARTLLEGEERTVPQNAASATVHCHNVLSLINHQSAPPTVPPTTIFESSESRCEERNTSTVDHQPCVSTGAEPVLGDDTEVEQTKSSPTANQNEFFPINVGDGNEEEHNVIQKASSYELESFASFGTAILPVKSTTSYDDTERRRVQTAQETLDDSVLMSTTADQDESDHRQPPMSRPPARKVSEGSHCDVATEVYSLENSQSGEDEDRIIAVGSVEDALQSFASFGVAILPTVSCSRDDDDDDKETYSESSTLTSFYPCTRPTILVHDSGLLQLKPTQEDSEGDVCDDENADDMTQLQQVVTASIFRPLISPSIQSRVEDLSSKATSLGPVALPLTSRKPPTSHDEELVDDVGKEEHDVTLEGNGRGENEDSDPRPPQDDTAGLPPSISVVREGRTNVENHESSSLFPKGTATAAAAALPTSTFLGFTWSSSIMPAAW